MFPRREEVGTALMALLLSGLLGNYESTDTGGIILATYTYLLHRVRHDSTIMLPRHVLAEFKGFHVFGLARTGKR
jgi:hypothetical protein